MKLGVPWSVPGIRPKARATARKAAQRSGMSVGEWLNTVILDSASEDDHDDTPHAGSDDVAAVNTRLDNLTRRIDQLARIAARGRDFQPDAPHASLPAAQIAPQVAPPLAPELTRASPGPKPQSAYVPAGAAAYAPKRPALPAWTANLDTAVAEISARRRALNGEFGTSFREAESQTPAVETRGPRPPRNERADTDMEPPPSIVTRPHIPTQDLSGLEGQLRQITNRFDTLRMPGVEKAVNALRDELTDMHRSLDDAMPRRAIQAIEQQIHDLTQRIAEGRQAGVDGRALAGVEQGLAEVRDALYHLAPAESLVGFGDAIQGLADKIDLIVAQRDPSSIEHLERAINTMRDISAHIASDEAVSRVASDVAMLAEKVDRLAYAGATADALSGLEQRIAALADALAARTEASRVPSPYLEELVASIGDKLDRLQESRNDGVAFNALEDRIVKLVEKLDASDSRLAHLEAVERGLGDLLIQMSELRTQRAQGVHGVFGEPPEGVEALKSGLARTQSEIEAVHGTLGQLLDRLATIEHNILTARTSEAEWPPSAPPVELDNDAELFEQPPEAEPFEQPAQTPPFEQPPQTFSFEQVAYAPPVEQPPEAVVPPPHHEEIPLPPPAPPRALPRSLAPAPQLESPPIAPAAPPLRSHVTPIDPDLPPNQPIEPGAGPLHLRADAARRIAASEAALGPANLPPPEAPDSKSSFIAAARRAAQAAQKDKSARSSGRTTATSLGGIEGQTSMAGRLGKRIKSLFVAASVIAIVIGGLQIGSKYFDISIPGMIGGKHSQLATKPVATLTTQKTAEAEGDLPAKTKPPATPLPGMIPPPSEYGYLGPSSQPIASMAPLSAEPDRFAGADTSDVTGSVSQRPVERAPATAVTAPQTVPADGLPAAIGGAALRKAAASGDAGAAYEVAVRLAEGRGVPADPTESIRWFERAAARGLAPAQFRLGSVYEKGLGVKKDLDKARQYYRAAAAQGNAKAMHNLAVLYAEGIGGKPDFKTASEWFIKAADHGVADSEYNLAVLYARGLGVEKNLAESYKWFALAASQGDKEAAHKRDEVAAHLEPGDLAAAKKAVSTFVPKKQPAAAITVPQPAGGWNQG